MPKISTAIETTSNPQPTADEIHLMLDSDQRPERVDNGQRLVAQ
jgi:hypothetical protein